MLKFTYPQLIALIQFLPIFLMFYSSCEAQTGGTILSLETKDFILKIDSEEGARVVKFGSHETNMLMENDRQVKNYGSTLWTSPQSDWGWPPSHALHFGNYQVVKKSPRQIILESAVDNSGVQLTKDFNIVDEAIQITYKLSNRSDHTKDVGLWEVSSVPARGLFFYKSSKSQHGFVDSKFQLLETLGTNFYFLNEETRLIKKKNFGFSDSGWMAYLNEGMLWVKTFKDVPNDEIAPSHGEIELFANTALGYMEIENHGNFESLDPEDFLEYQVVWHLKKLPDGIDTTIVSKELLDFIQKEVLK